MNNRLVVMLACLVAIAARSQAGTTAAEAEVRKADAEWAAAARTANVDAWMAFYAADAIVMPPNLPLANDRERIRRTVTDLLTLPHVSLSWSAIKVELAGSGDLAYLIGAYDLRFDDPRGAPVSDRGKLLEVWKKQADGSWKCIVDAWNSDGVSATRPAAAPAPTVAEPAAQTASHTAASEYGDMPTHWEETIRQYFQTYLRDPGSVRYQEITPPVKGAVTTVTGVILAHETRRPGWTVKATINAKNSQGGYVGFKTYTFLFRGERIIHTVSPLAEDEMK